MNAAPDIFLSYNREDQARARLFAEAFAAQGFNVWWDANLKSGEAYDEVTEAALRSARAVVVLWSKKSVVSRWVRAEATLAERNKTLIPCMIEPCERPIMFELVQTAELAHWQGGSGDKAWIAFMSDVQRFIGGQAELAPVRETLREIIDEPPKPAETLLAVLPFDNLSSDAEMQFFSDGVSEDILGRIMRGSKLKVISRTSSFQFRGPDKPKAAAALKATHVVDGSIRRAGGKVRINAHLTETLTQTTLWSDKFDRSLEDIFAVQDEISEAIAAALDTAFFPHKTMAIDPAAYDLYLRTRQSGVQPESLARGIAAMDSVTRMAPDFADAWALLAHMRTFASMHLPYAERAPLRALAEANTSRCLTLDPDNPNGIVNRWMCFDPFGAYLEQEVVCSRARELGSNSANAQVGLTFFLEGVGRMREAVTFARRGYELDPRSENTSALCGMSLWRSGRFAEGRAAMEAHIETWPDSSDTAALLILACAHQQDWAAVDALITPQRLAKYPLREHSALIGLLALLRSPEREVRRVIVDMVSANVARSGHVDQMPLMWMAELGFVAEAFDILDGAKLGPAGHESDTLGPNAYRSHMIFAVAYPALRADPRFVKLCARLGLVEYWLETQKWPDCAAETPYDFRAACEAHRHTPKDRFGA
jgi:TolB-like protein